MEPIIAMITDFGYKDPFVGIMKGVIRSIGSVSEIIDITHEIKQGDISSASFVISASFNYFPESTIFLAVVDPGVGTSRRPIAVAIENKYIVCPDNGIISSLAKRFHISNIIHITKKECFLQNVSSTFHGRDVFAPAASYISQGTSISDMGEPISDVVLLAEPSISIGEFHIEGEVIYIDIYGNLITNINKSIIDNWLAGMSTDRLRVHTGAIEIVGISQSYSGVAPNKPLALFGSMDTLEIALNSSNAAGLTGNKTGSKVLVYK